MTRSAVIDEVTSEACPATRSFYVRTAVSTTWQGMAAANQRMRDRTGVVERIAEASMRHHYTHLVHFDLEHDCLVAERDGTTVGYVRTEWHDLVWLARAG